MKRFSFLTICCLLFVLGFAQQKNTIKPGAIWPDDNGVHINAHGGGVIYHNKTYYWFGEHKVEGNKGNKAYVGVHCYSSRDLVNWKDEGIALGIDDNPGSLIPSGCIIERPKVIYNEKTKKFVMWFHLELKDQGYAAALSGVATSDKVEGPYTFHHAERPNKGKWPIGYVNENKVTDSILKRDIAGGQMARDMTLFAEGKKAYLIYSSEENLTLQISQLSDDFLTTSGKYVRVFPGGENEAPAIFKHKGKYWMVTSGLSGWAPNAARSAVAKNMMGPWTSLGNPCRGADSALTFHGQSTHVLPVQGKKGAFIFMGDRWNPDNAIGGRYLWLPVRFEKDRFTITWQDEWSVEEAF